MIIGVLKEIKTEEYRVGVPPMAADTLAKAGHQVLVQTTAGEGSSFTDEEYAKAVGGGELCGVRIIGTLNGNS